MCFLEQLTSSSEEVDDAYEEMYVGKKSAKPAIEPLKPPNFSKNKGFNVKDWSARTEVNRNGTVKNFPIAQQSSLYSHPLKPILRREKSADEAESGKPIPKKRVSPVVRQSRHSSLHDIIQGSENTNNSNIRPALPEKPKGLVSETINLHLNKLADTKEERKAPLIPKKNLLPDVSL